MDQHYLFLKSLIEDRALSHKTFRVFYINVPLFLQKVQKSFSFVPCFLAQPHSLPAAQPASHPASRKNSMTLLPPLCNKEDYWERIARCISCNIQRPRQEWHAKFVRWPDFSLFSFAWLVVFNFHHKKYETTISQCPKIVGRETISCLWLSGLDHRSVFPTERGRRGLIVCQTTFECYELSSWDSCWKTIVTLNMMHSLS